MADHDLTSSLSNFSQTLILISLIIGIILLLIYIYYLSKKRPNTTDKYRPYEIKGVENYERQINSSANQEKLAEVKYQPYTKKHYFFSVCELKFYELLKEVIGDHYYIYPKVRICDIIEQENKGNYSDFNRIKSKHVDFLICTKNPITSKIIVELDDRSHNSQSRRERDRFIDEIFANAGIPIVHIKARRWYDREELKTKLQQANKIEYVIKQKED
jgi:ribosomal protein L33